jgi:hypothetical protein
MSLGISQSAVPRSDGEIIDGILCRTSSVHNILQERLSDLQILKEPWCRQDFKQALTQLRDMRNAGAAVDLLKLISQRPNILTLEISCLLLSIVGELFFEIYEEYMHLT